LSRLARGVGRVRIAERTTRGLWLPSAARMSPRRQAGTCTGRSACRKPFGSTRSKRAGRRGRRHGSPTRTGSVDRWAPSQAPAPRRGAGPRAAGLERAGSGRAAGGRGGRVRPGAAALLSGRRGGPLVESSGTALAGYGTSTAAPRSRPSRRRARASFACSSGKISVSVRTGTRGASARNSSPSRRVRFATEQRVRSCHSSS